jgi:hypothetical protein
LATASASSPPERSAIGYELTEICTRAAGDPRHRIELLVGRAAFIVR